jgi:hypothetical protein
MIKEEEDIKDKKNGAKTFYKTTYGITTFNQTTCSLKLFRMSFSRMTLVRKHLVE